MSRYIRNIVLGLLIAAPLVLVPSLAANAVPPANATSAPSSPHTPPGSHESSSEPTVPVLTNEPAEEGVVPPDSVVPLDSGEYQSPPLVDGAQTPYDLLEDRVNALSASMKWMSVGNFGLLVMIIALLLRGRKKPQRPELDPEPTYKLN